MVAQRCAAVAVPMPAQAGRAGRASTAGLSGHAARPISPGTMPDYTYPLARVFALVGGAAVAVATLVSWYDYEVILDFGRIAQLFEVPVNLWNHDALAAALLLAAGLAAMALLVAPPAVGPRWPSFCAALLGLGVVVYAVYRCFDVPDLGIRAVPGAGVQARTYVDAGPLLAVVGGVMIVMGSLVVLVGAHRTVTAGARAARVSSPPGGPATAGFGHGDR
jgi:hypothetical protein